jgi:methylated-DNA-[protein]-cysteine S-methyltransferase
MSPSALHFDTVDSPVGPLTLIASERGLRAVLWKQEKPGRVPLESRPERRPDQEVIVEAKAQLAGYFAGRRTAFDLPLDWQGTDFQIRAWESLRKIPYGQTLSYGEQAAKLGDPHLARAVGAANGKNPLSIVVPCHRVVGTSNKLTGFAGGLHVKRFLLELEGHNCKGELVVRPGTV